MDPADQSETDQADSDPFIGSQYAPGGQRAEAGEGRGRFDEGPAIKAG